MSIYTEKIQEFYPGLRCHFTDDWHNYYAGNIVIISRVVKNAYPGGVHKIIFDDGYVISSSTAQEVLTVDHLPFIQEKLVENEDMLSKLHENLEAVLHKPQAFQDIFGEYARDLKPDESRERSYCEEIKRRVAFNNFLRSYEKAVFSFMSKYVNDETKTSFAKSSIGIWREGLFDIKITLDAITVGGMRIFNFHDYTSPEKINSDKGTEVECIQRAFEAELNAVGIDCTIEDEFGM